MLRWLFPSPSEARLLGQERLRGPTAWVIAIMSFSIMTIAAAGLALANTAGTLSNAIQARYSIEIPGGSGRIDDLLATVRSAPGTRERAGGSGSRDRRTLERWLGPAAQSSELPVPALVNFDLEFGYFASRSSPASSGDRSRSHDRDASRSCRPIASLASPTAMGSVRPCFAPQRRGIGRGRARGAWSARHPSLHHRGDARDRSDRRPGHQPISAQDCDRCIGRQPRGGGRRCNSPPDAKRRSGLRG